jgi:hypothetical protein
MILGCLVVDGVSLYLTAEGILWVSDIWPKPRSSVLAHSELGAEANVTHGFGNPKPQAWLGPASCHSTGRFDAHFERKDDRHNPESHPRSHFPPVGIVGLYLRS